MNRPVEDPAPDPLGGGRGTADEELLCACGPELAAGDPARVERIAAELAAGFAAMRDIVTSGHAAQVAALHSH